MGSSNSSSRTPSHDDLTLPNAHVMCLLLSNSNCGENQSGTIVHTCSYVHSLPTNLLDDARKPFACFMIPHLSIGVAVVLGIVLHRGRSRHFPERPARVFVDVVW